MFIIYLILIILLKNVLCQQGIYDPSTFTQANCFGNYKWTNWFDTNDPTFSQADFELTDHIKRLLPLFMCQIPIAIEAQTSFDTNPSTTGDVFRLTLTDGFMCLNQYIPYYQNKLCTDYKVRFCCPI